MAREGLRCVVAAPTVVFRGDSNIKQASPTFVGGLWGQGITQRRQNLSLYNHIAGHLRNVVPIQAKKENNTTLHLLKTRTNECSVLRYG